MFDLDWLMDSVVILMLVMDDFLFLEICLNTSTSLWQ